MELPQFELHMHMDCIQIIIKNVRLLCAAIKTIFSDQSNFQSFNSWLDLILSCTSEESIFTLHVKCKFNEFKIFPLARILFPK